MTYNTNHTVWADTFGVTQPINTIQCLLYFYETKGSDQKVSVFILSTMNTIPKGSIFIYKCCDISMMQFAMHKQENGSQMQANSSWQQSTWAELSRSFFLPITTLHRCINPHAPSHGPMWLLSSSPNDLKMWKRSNSQILLDFSKTEYKKCLQLWKNHWNNKCIRPEGVYLERDCSVIKVRLILLVSQRQSGYFLGRPCIYLSTARSFTRLSFVT